MNRFDLQELAETRIQEAEALFNNGFYAGAYYLVGYAVECALKACIARKVNQYDFPDKKLTSDSYTHELPKLMGLVTDVKSALDKELSSNSTFNVNWNTVLSWKEDARYRVHITQADATDLINAVADNTNGVVTWLKKYW